MSASSLGIDRWRHIIHELEGSGLATKDFAERHRLTASAVYYWRRRLADEPKQVPSTSLAVAFVEVLPEQHAPTRAAEPYEIGLRNGRTVTVPPAFDDRVLGRLLAVVEGGA